MELCRELFGWSVEESQFILNKINEWGIDTELLHEELCATCSNFRDINDIKLALFVTQAEKVKERISDILREDDIRFSQPKLSEYDASIDTTGFIYKFDDYSFWSKPAEDITMDDIEGFLAKEDMLNFEYATYEEEQKAKDKANGYETIFEYEPDNYEYYDDDDYFYEALSEIFDFPVSLVAQGSDWRGNDGYTDADTPKELISKCMGFGNEYLSLRKSDEGYYFKTSSHDVPTGFNIYIK
jgi:hypothetical protein